jgi:hypothetical protein
VNQRGQTSYTLNGYTIDRWSIWNGSVTVSDGYITANVMYQFLELPLDKVYTFAVCRDDGNITIVSGSPSAPAAVENDGMTINITNLSGYAEVVISGNKNVVWAALYEGEYTVDTLPEYQPKGYGVELAECQRYFQNISDAIVTSGGLGHICYPTVMRINPTLNLASWGGYTLTVVFGSMYGCCISGFPEGVSTNGVNLTASADL